MPRPQPHPRPPLPAARRAAARLAPIGVALAALALLAAGAGRAAAATPFTAGTGVRPAVAVAPDGTGHVVWETGGANAKVGYCRVAPGAGACTDSRLLTFRDYPAVAAAGRAQVFVSPTEPDEIWVKAGCVQCPSGDTTSKTIGWVSTDGGDSFSAAFAMDEGTPVTGRGTLLFDLAPTFVGTNASRIKAGPGVPGFEGVRFASGGVFSYGAGVARVPLPGELRLVAAVNDLHTVKYGVYRSAEPPSAASINRPENWEVDKALVAAEPDNSDTALNSGPNGLFLTYLSEGADGPRIGLRRFDPATDAFGLPTYVEGGDPIEASVQAPASFQDPAGRIHVVWESLHDGGRLRYAVSDAAAAGFSAAANLAAGERFGEPRVAAAADGRGFAVWSGAAGEVRVVALDPRPEPAGPPPAGPGGSAGPGAPPGSAGPGRTGPRGGGHAPRVRGATLGRRALRPGEATELRFRSSAAGAAVLTIAKRFRGLRAGGGRERTARNRCRPRTAKRLRALRRRSPTRRAYRRLLRRRGCRGWRRVGRIKRRVRPGPNAIRLGNRVAGRRLGPGHYRARLVVTDAAGHRSRAETVRFKVLARRRGAGRG